MKKVLIILMVAVLLTGCNTQNKTQEQFSSGVWLSYSEVNNLLTSEKGFKTEFETVVKNCKELNIQNLYIHVRPFCDSLFKSDYYPLMENAVGHDFDILEYVIKKCHAEKIKVHAWINPYRVSTATQNIDEISSNSPAYKWLKDQNSENDANVVFNNGIYLNPAENQVRQLVIDGIREIIAKYDVDGIHFDDYFYPTVNESFDNVSYLNYKSQTENPLNIADWRRMNVNSLISGCYSAIKYADEDIIFSVSPMAEIEHNYNNLFADVGEWIKKGYLDAVIPQIYFGFEYPKENFCFEKLINDWKSLASCNENVKLIIGLASYKAIPELDADKPEWTNNSDIVARQVEFCKNDEKIDGCVYFSYSSLFGEKEAYLSQRQNILEYLKSEDKNG